MNVWLMLFLCPDEMGGPEVGSVSEQLGGPVIAVLNGDPTRPRLDQWHSSQLDSSPLKEAVTVRGDGSTGGLIK